MSTAQEDLAGLGDAMPSPPAAEQVADLDERQRAPLWARLGTAAVFGAIGIVPPAVGAIVGLTHPSSIEFAPGIEANSRVQLGSTSNIDLGGAGGALFPRFHKPLPVIGNISASLTVDRAIEVPLANKDKLALYSALLDNPERSIIRPITQRAVDNAVTGGLAGAVADVGITGILLAGRRSRRRKQRKQAEILDEHVTTLTDAGALTSPAVEQSVAALKSAILPERKIRRFSRRVVACGAVLGVWAAGAAISYDRLHAHNTGVDQATLQPLDEQLVALDSAKLAGASLYGSPAQYAINNGGRFVLDYMNRVDAQNEQVVRNIDAQFAKLNPAVVGEYLNNPNYTVAAVVSDIHCNLSWMHTVLPAVLHRFNARLVINGGDTDVSTGTLPFESDCVSTLADALQPTQAYPEQIDMVAVMGNHDNSKTTGADMRRARVTGTDGKHYDPITVVDANDGGTATIDGFTFVGLSDPRQSVSNIPIQPNSPEAQAEAVAKQGNKVAALARTVTEKTGIPPIVITHDERAGYAALLQGDASLAVSGHLHQQAPIEQIGDGYLFNQGASSGPGVDEFTEYAKPNRDAPVTMIILDNSTKRPVGYFNVMAHADLSVDPITFAPMPAGSTSLDGMSEFLQTYDPADAIALPEPKPNQLHDHAAKLQADGVSAHSHGR